MKAKKALSIALAVTVAAALAACDGKKPEPLTDAKPTGTVLADFTRGEADTFFASSGWCNGDPFNVTWDDGNVDYENGSMNLSIKDAAQSASVPYLGGELRSHHHFVYGDYSVRMKPAKVPGSASTFFTSTGPSESDEDDNPNPHDEIDIEFLGSDTTRVQFNYFVNGKGGNEYWYDLGFDASLEYHDYGFRWTAEYIVWFVDDEPVYKVTASANNPLPTTPGRILMNHWCGTVRAEGWMGKYAGSNGAVASYTTVKTSATPIGEIPQPPATGDLTVPTAGWTDIDVAGFGGWNSGYTLDLTDGIAISHDTAVKDWKCEGMTLANSYSWVKFTVKNNIATPALIWIDIKKQGGANGVLAAVSECKGVKVDSAEARLVINLAANETADVAVKIKDMAVDQFVVFLNSVSTDFGTAAGDIKISGLQGVVNTEIEPPAPPQPPVGDTAALTFVNTETYMVDKSGEAATEITVTYTDIAGSTYKNIAAPAAELAADKDTFSVKIKNNGTEAVTVRIDLIGERKVTVGSNPNMECCNLSATATGGTGLYTDTTWGGTKLTVAAGEEVTVVITYSNVGEMGAAQRVQLYLDTATEGQSCDLFSGNVTFGEFKFTKSQIAEE